MAALLRLQRDCRAAASVEFILVAPAILVIAAISSEFDRRSYYYGLVSRIANSEAQILAQTRQGITAAELTRAGNVPIVLMREFHSRTAGDFAWTNQMQAILSAVRLIPAQDGAPPVAMLMWSAAYNTQGFVRSCGPQALTDDPSEQGTDVLPSDATKTGGQTELIVVDVKYVYKPLIPLPGFGRPVMTARAIAASLYGLPLSLDTRAAAPFPDWPQITVCPAG